MARPRKFNEIIKLNNKFSYIICKHGKVLIDNFNLDKIQKFTWFTKKTGNSDYYVYASITENKKERKISLHRFLMNPNKTEFIDHANRNPLDNRIKNLRICTKSDNNRNAKKNIRGLSKYKGVTKRPSGRYAAYISFNLKTICLGTFDLEKDAALAYNKKAGELFGKFANLNKIGVLNENK